ncbi:unnamed protein product [Bursaphelenchus okinawaensis]|uniref:Uncharacterized protein n=1 Tax=Bursaphelenchus okinawaensis TaxID=465554 RepID=A0A811L3A5_9BILA|nr:unnamed protein product [Bursaphelenchus okinawaensis]CAG9116752.1 unnamed protein product [Bursaphelenchus okinawaensis]
MRKSKNSRRRNSRNDKTLMTEDDGTQMETGTEKRKKKKDNNATRSVEEPSVAPASKGGKKLGAGRESPEYKNVMLEFVKHCLEAGVQAKAAEFIQLKQETNVPGPKTAFDANPTKNRYKDVICIDASRVRLSGVNDYIHANYMDYEGFDRKYICTQAPLDKTIEEFWKMIMETKSVAIVMLCNIMEQGKKKCAQYWPDADGASSTHGDFTVTNKGVRQPEQQLTETALEVKNASGDTFNTTHFFWHGWPDRGVPEDSMACFRLINKLNRYCPVMVHCSAGIGRTGTIIGLDYAHQLLRKGEQVRLKDVVKEMRKHRHNSVQTAVQYVFMHRALIGVAINKKFITQSECEKYLEEVQKYIDLVELKNKG